MKLKKEQYLIIILAVTLLAVASSMIFFILTATPQQPPSATPAPTIPTSFISNPKLPVRYDKPTFDKLVDRVENKRQLAEEDIAAKNRILSILPDGKTSGVLYNSPEIIIDYTSGVDLFQVEILTTNIEGAKEMGAMWFIEQGVSQKGICDLPVDFYLNWEVANELRGRNITFSPLAEGC